MPFIGNKPSAVPLTSADITDGIITASKLADGVNDDEDIKWDIATLALQQATDANKSAYALPNIFVDQFEDSTGIDVATSTARTSSEYVATIYTDPKYFYKPSTDYWTFTQSSTGIADGGGSGVTVVAWVRGNGASSWTANGSQGGGFINLATTASSYYQVFNIGNGGNNGELGIHTPGWSDFNTDSAISAPASDWVLIYGKNTGGAWNSTYSTIGWRARTDSSWTVQAQGNGGTDNKGITGSGQGRLFRHGSNTYTNDAENNQVAHMAWFNSPLSESALTSLWNNGKTFDWTTSNGNYSPTYLRDYFKFNEGSGTTLTNSGDGGNATKQSGSGSWDSDSSQLSISVNNSSGNFTSVSKTAPATVSKMGIVVLYKNQSGTATLNTDLIAQVSADNGSNYSTVTLTPRGTFSSGINIATSSAVSVTPGTSCKYKISFANQSSGSKETQVYGVALQY